MAAQTIRPGDLVTIDPSARKVYQFDWTDYLTDLGTGEVIGTTTFVITGPDALMTFDNSGIVSGNLKTQLRVIPGAAVAGTYVCTNRIVTNGSPQQTDERSFTLLVQDR